LTAFNVDQQGVVAVAHPHVSVGRVGQTEVPVVLNPVSTVPERVWQDLAIGPPLIVPARRRIVGLPAVAALGVTVPLVGVWIEVLAILLPLRRAMAGLI
jgi:hypothetical protein